MNAPDRYERFVVPEGTKKVSYERDTKIINAATFTVEREDHTVGNILRMQLHRDPNVLFAGYKLPHPLQYKILVRVRASFLDLTGKVPISHCHLLVQTSDSWILGFCKWVPGFDGRFQIHTTSQSSPMQAYNQAITDLDKELDYLKNAFENEKSRFQNAKY
ncbi:hypothetical protein Taro_050642 [Colocasia esculenta]|uniref:DNA-directed RNA polymerase RBP11-like dimerisation domain-containing protein n=1 Tax=Colocasia esculenta TaxID=4460 RepID=A0A843XEB7_COLES|nr:hypothetical protein [Colocasia esculenta]